MDTKKIWANLAVNDVEKTWEFYLRLGFKPNCPPSTKELASFVIGDDNFVIHFFEKDRFESSVEGEIADLSEGNEVMFTLSAESKDEVDKWVEEVKKAGGAILFNPQKDNKDLYDENGYYVCVFSDPDGHKFNVFFNSNKK
ncbi:VOC family protein [Aliifodinibius sp. S!AR15-10]|uniref:VOC family protein n=1 Tax=Aliifodinibius sp. S!AR15-10 TaxID=2950437 RepID=UPI0028618AB7|nr:VOC family protein [Aliifodinibius sp. S!AR15-10]MDR8393934.1 VOC family protein [Aliifodinibius sp. S!AR15-10]